ncbi:MAG: hypothetical protein C4K48_03315 [Candidatus Thorarchaeota archaeon]|nr:MAG: hypothetical protein C4K48_03315 [Candidatus Thorarchaeota archaeon]
MHDYHVHPNYSIDAEGSVEDFCEAALQRGLKEIAFTTHLDTDMTTDDCHVVVRGKRMDTLSGEWLENYEATIRAAHDTYKEKGLRVLLGIEVDYIDDLESLLPEQFYSADFDIILGSTHLINHGAISAGDRAEDTFKRYSMEELGEVYYAHLLRAIETGLFDIMAHLDLYRRFGQGFYGEGILNIWKPYLKDLANAMKRHNVGFEVNTSPLRTGQDDPMPEEGIIRALRKAGVLNVTTGSDAHRPSDVGAGIVEVTDLLKKVGYSTITTFNHRRPRNLKI